MGFMQVTSSTWEVALCPKVSWSFKQDAERVKALALYHRAVTLCLIKVTQSFLNLRPLVSQGIYKVILWLIEVALELISTDWDLERSLKVIQSFKALQRLVEASKRTLKVSGKSLNAMKSIFEASGRSFEKDGDMRTLKSNNEPH